MRRRRRKQCDYCQKKTYFYAEVKTEYYLCESCLNDYKKGKINLFEPKPELNYVYDPEEFMRACAKMYVQISRKKAEDMTDSEVDFIYEFSKTPWFRAKVR